MTKPDSIFVLIASYRDPECQWTVRDLFDKAGNPERIRVGICWQADPEEDRHCFEIETRPEQVDIVHFLPEESHGVCWARSRAQALLRNEDYALQIDSHMRFVEDWDERMIGMLGQCDSPWPVLTVYPPAYTPPDQLDLDAPARVQCVKEFSRTGIVCYSAKSPPAGVQPTAPMATACFAGGFVFGAARWMRAVAQDPEIYFLGEEYSMAARLWTHGFDLYSPHETLIYHYYIRKETSRPWDDDPDWVEKNKKSLLRLRQLLTPATVPERDRVDLGEYGLGRERSLADYEAYAGVSFSARSIASYARSFPYVRTKAVAAELLTDRNLQASDQAALFIVDDEGLLFSAARGEIYHLNKAATYVWCGLEDGASWDKLVSGLGNFCSMPAADAEATLANLVVHWRGQGVLRGNEADSDEAELAPSREELPEAVDEDAVAFPLDPPVQRDQYYQVLGSCFCVQFCGHEQADWLMPALTHFEVSVGQAADHVITVYEEGGRHHIFRDKELVHTDKLISELAPYLKHQLVRTALDGYNHILNLHAGAVSKNDALIALPAQSGGGKSTLVAGLIKRDFQYFSDELVPLARGSCAAIPVPLGLCIKDSAFSVLQEQYPEVLEQPIHDRADGRRAVYLPPPEESIAGSDQARLISHIVFPRYEAGAVTALKAIPRVEAFARVMEQCVSIPKPLTLDDAAALVHWVEQVQCYDLVLGSLEAAMDQIEHIIAE